MYFIQFIRFTIDRYDFIISSDQYYNDMGLKRSDYLWEKYALSIIGYSVLYPLEVMHQNRC